MPGVATAASRKQAAISVNGEAINMVSKAELIIIMIGMCISGKIRREIITELIDR